MKTFICSFATLICCAAIHLPAKEIQWDFSKGIKPNAPLEFALSPQATIDDGFLYVKDPIDRNNRGGLIAANKYPELTPKGAFRMTFVFSLEKPRSPQYYLMLWDSKGDYYNKKTGKAIDNSGFTIAIFRPKNSSTMAVHAWLGFGNRTALIQGKRVPFEEEKKYTLDVDYDGSGKYAFYLDGTPIGNGTVAQGGAIAPALYKPVIGNRAVGSFFPFDGKIYSVKMIKHEEGK